MDYNIRRKIARHVITAGYRRSQANAGIAYAVEHGATTARDGYALALSRILYTDDQLADGARFAVEEGCGPR